MTLITLLGLTTLGVLAGGVGVIWLITPQNVQCDENSGRREAYRQIYQKG